MDTVDYKTSKISIWKRLGMPLPELEDYYREQRKYRFQQGKRLKHIGLREALYPLFVKFLVIDRLFRKQTITTMGNQRKYKKPVIYACTHIGENDLENIYEKISRGCWWFVGDPCILYKNISGLWLYLNGCILLETGDKVDRHIAYRRAVELLKGGGSLMIFPEGARNGTENLPVMELFPGAVKMSIETDTPIVPVGIEQYDRRFVINFGEALSPVEYPVQEEFKVVLRDAMATLKWEIWEREGIQSRSNLSENYRELFLQEFEKRIQPWDTLETVERSRFHSKSELEQREVSAYL
ncbi:MAG: 1-acyl-sn-glycerol-3-phosphate acyltransferase [Clostridiales bacterium]|nr:1-acyl-sn-glycerol-3-phosphate acyltransferase [Clostridiales bacterium]